MIVGKQAYSPESLRKLILADKKIKTGLRAEELREQMDPKAIMTSLLALVTEADSIEMVELPKLKFKADIYTTLLRKCMPDLRTLEIKEGDSGKNVLTIEMGASKIDAPPT